MKSWRFYCQIGDALRVSTLSAQKFQKQPSPPSLVKAAMHVIVSNWYLLPIASNSLKFHCPTKLLYTYYTVLLYLPNRLQFSSFYSAVDLVGVILENTRMWCT